MEKQQGTAYEWLDNMKYTSFHTLIIVLLCLVLIFDGYDSQIVAYIMPLASKEWGLTPVMTGSLASWGFVGLMLGTSCFGFLSDRIGRKKALIIAISFFTLFSGAAFFAPNYSIFVALRVLAGVGMGGAMPICITMISEYSPARIRGKAVTAMYGGFTTGWIAAALAAIGVIPSFGWRPVFLMGALPILMIPILIKYMPESVRFLASKGRHEDAIKEIRKIEKLTGQKPIDWKPDHFAIAEVKYSGTIKDLFTPGLIRMTFLISGTYFFNLIVVYGLASWLPTLLVQRGFSLVKSYNYGMIQAVAASVGAFFIGTLLDIFGRKKTLIAGYLIGAVSLVLFGYATSGPVLMAAGAAAGFFIIGTQTTLHVVNGETYPTHIRSTGVGFTYTFGRIGSFAAPLVGGALLAAKVSFSAYFVIFAIPCVLCACCVAGYKTAVRGEGLEHVAQNIVGKVTS